MFLFSYLFPPNPFSPSNPPRPQYRTMRHLPDELILHIISCEHHRRNRAPNTPPLTPPPQSSSQQNSYACSSSPASSSTSPATTTYGSDYASSTPPPSADAVVCSPLQISILDLRSLSEQLIASPTHSQHPYTTLSPRAPMCRPSTMRRRGGRRCWRTGILLIRRRR